MAVVEWIKPGQDMAISLDAAAVASAYVREIINSGVHSVLTRFASNELIISSTRNQDGSPIQNDTCADYCADEHNKNKPKLKRSASVNFDELCTVRMYHCSVDERRYKLDDEEWTPCPTWDKLPAFVAHDESDLPHTTKFARLSSCTIIDHTEEDPLKAKFPF